MTIEEKIETALKEHAAALSVFGTPTISWPNDSFPTDGSPKPASYIEIRHFPNTVTRLGMRGGDAHFRQGILQLTAYRPLLEGSDQATRVAGEIAEHFPADLKLFNDGARIDVQAAPSLSQADKSDDGVSWFVHVSVRYQCLG